MGEFCGGVVAVVVVQLYLLADVNAVSVVDFSSLNSSELLL